MRPTSRVVLQLLMGFEAKLSVFLLLFDSGSSFAIAPSLPGVYAMVVQCFTYGILIAASNTLISAYRLCLTLSMQEGARESLTIRALYYSAYQWTCLTVSRSNYSPVWSWSIILGSDLKSITVFCSYRPQRRKQSEEAESLVSYATYGFSGQCIRSGRKCFPVDSIYLHNACFAGNDGQISIDAVGRRHGTISQTCLNLEFDEIGYSFLEPQGPSLEISKYYLSATTRGWNTVYYGAFATTKGRAVDPDSAGVCLGTKCVIHIRCY
jgi:hypothetical protein